MDLLTVSEVAQILKTNKNYVYALHNAGLLRFIKLGSYKIRRETLQEFLEKYDGFDVTNPFEIKELRP